jgi:AcrR family transcriptional regulator
VHRRIEGRTEGARSKRSAIVTAAIDRFAADGFEHTRWATVAEDVGISEGTLYYYFESKAECLLSIMRMELAALLERLEHVTRSLDDPSEALRAAVRSAFQGAAHEARQRQILHNHFDLLGTPRPSPSEECERRTATALVWALEQGWAGLIRRGVQSGDFAGRDVDMTARLALALVVAAWQQYQPDRGYTPDEIGLLTADAVLRLVA